MSANADSFNMPRLARNGNRHGQRGTGRGWRRCHSVIGMGVATLLSVSTVSPVSAGPSLRGSRTVYGRKRSLQGADGGAAATPEPTASATAADTEAAEPRYPDCSSVLVPNAAGHLAGVYSHDGRFNGERPVFSNPENGGRLFAQGSSATAVNWFITSTSSTFFLSLASLAYEPGDMAPFQAWVRNNDPTCSSSFATPCAVNITIDCEVLTADLLTAAPTATPTSWTDAENASSSNSTGDASYDSTTVTQAPSTAPLLSSSEVDPTPVPTSAPTEIDIQGCESLAVGSAGARNGVYLFDGVYSNDRPVFTITGLDNRTDQVFSTTENACIENWGLVNATWAENKGALGSDATDRQVLLMYLSTLDLAVAADGCSIDVWYVTAGGVTGVGNAGADTFFSVSVSDDPSEIELWAQFTPAAETAAATIEENFWTQVGCADDAQVKAAATLGGADTVQVPP